ncbi:hypothetical protein PoB_006816800 [Plakobranchus ocellatus]|uniref:Uncharacterized protein n=1 Tax=Plakobranchus ocellatus TaxID=259542 RepID=A0AAV4DC80_9GAST|nr:hypothetical protein PoB_006816800 [Plakobranchus ocellatus]
MVYSSYWKVRDYAYYARPFVKPGRRWGPCRSQGHLLSTVPSMHPRLKEAQWTCGLVRRSLASLAVLCYTITLNYGRCIPKNDHACDALFTRRRDGIAQYVTFFCDFPAGGCCSYDRFFLILGLRDQKSQVITQPPGV